MITVDTIRQVRAVQEGDATPLSQRYGYKVATMEQLKAAKEFVGLVVQEAERRIDAYLEAMFAVGENPYKLNIQIPGRYSSKTIHHAAHIEVFTTAEVDAMYANAFPPVAEGTAPIYPEAATLRRTALDEVAALYRSVGKFEVCYAGEEKQMMIIIMRDPEYVAGREAYDKVAEQNTKGAAKDRNFFRRTAIALKLAKPFQPAALPPPGPRAVAQLPAPPPAAPSEPVEVAQPTVAFPMASAN